MALFDSQVRSVVDLMRFDVGLRNRINRILLKVQREIVSDIAVIDPARATRSTIVRRRLSRLNESVAGTINTQFPQARDTMLRELRGLSQFEASRYASDLNRAIKANVFDVTLSKQQLDSLVNNSMISGNTIGQWWTDKSVSFKRKFGAEMRQATADFQAGFVKGDSVGVLVSRVKGKLGFMNNVRRETEALVRTSTMQVANNVRSEVIDDNLDIVDKIQVVATLDMKTTPICRGLDSLMWDAASLEPVGHSQPYPGPPPFHWNCRSTIVPVTKTWAELSGPNSKLPKSKLDKIDRLTSRERASLGKPTKLKSYQTWLKSQTAEVQQEVLGKKRWEIWKNNNLTTLNLIDQTGRPLTLDQLYRKYEFAPRGSAELITLSHTASKTSTVSKTYSLDKTVGETKILKEDTISPIDPNYNSVVKNIEEKLKESNGILAKYGMPDEIRIHNSYNPSDAYWAKKYKIKNFKSGATGGIGKDGKAVINIWQPRFNVPSGLNKTIPHEQAHIAAKRITGSHDLGKYKNDWDHLIHMEGHSSSYAVKSKSVSEDFADYVVGRVDPKLVKPQKFGIPIEGDFVNLFPDKTKLFNKILESAE